MMELFGITLLRPEWFAAIALVVILAIFFAPRNAGLGGWVKAVDPELLQILERMGQVIPGQGGRNWLPAATALLIAIAALSPAERVRDAQSFRNLDGLVLVLDLSRSVGESENFDRAILAAREVLISAGQRPASVVIFAGDAYLVSAFTSDHQALSTMLSELKAGVVPDAGSRPHLGLEFARRSLNDASILDGDIVLISDGGGITEASFEEITQLTKLRARVSTVFVPTNASVAPADPEALIRIASAGNGKSGDIRNLAPIAELLSSETSTRFAASDIAALIWSDYGRFLLILALFPALAMFRKGRQF